MQINEYHAKGNILIAIPIDFILAGECDHEVRQFITNMILSQTKGVLVKEDYEIYMKRQLYEGKDRENAHLQKKDK